MAENKKSAEESKIAPEAPEPTPQNVPPPAPPVAPKAPLVLIGAPGSSFNINGNFGPVGTLSICGQNVVPTRWDERGLRGLFPFNVTDGEVTIVNGEGEVWTGHYPTKA